MEYRYVGNHARILDGGRPVGPGETVELDDEQVRLPDNEQLISQGDLIPLDNEAEHEASLAERRARARVNKEKEE